MNLTLNDIDWKALLIKKYQTYGLDEMDCMVLFVSDAVLDMEPNLLITCDVLSTYMKANKDAIDSSLSKLMAKNILTIQKTGGAFFSSLDDFKKRLFKDEVKDLVLKGGNNTSVISENLYSFLESINGPLSPIDRDRVAQWLKDGIEEEQIREACKKAMTKNGHISFKTADTYLLQMQRSESRKTIGASTVNEEENRAAELQKLIDSTKW